MMNDEREKDICFQLNEIKTTTANKGKQTTCGIKKYVTDTQTDRQTDRQMNLITV